MAAKPGKENKRNAYKGSYYTYGNVAYELQPDYAPYYEDDKKQQEAKEAIRQAAAERRENRVHAAHVCMVMLLIFAGCIAFMGATVIVKNQEVQIRKERRAGNAEIAERDFRSGTCGTDRSGIHQAGSHQSTGNGRTAALSDCIY